MPIQYKLDRVRIHFYHRQAGKNFAERLPIFTRASLNPRKAHS